MSRDLCTLLLIALAAAPVLAAEGRIPVFLPGTVLNTDGKYILTRNIAGPGPVISICSANVDLDLNGMVVTNTGGGETITTNGCPVTVDHVTIHNGTVVRGAPGIFVIGSTRRVDIEDVKVKDTVFPGAIQLVTVEGGAIRRVEITDTAGNGILWNGGVAHGTIEHNIIRRAASGMFIFGATSLTVQHNRIEEGAGGGITLFNGVGSLVAENTVDRKGNEGISIRNGLGIKVYNNVVTRNGSHGIYLDGTTIDSLVLNNIASANGAGPGTPARGILVEGSRNMIEGNIVNDNTGGGLILNPVVLGGACDNTYGRNTARGNGGAGVPVCGGAPPGQFGPNFCDFAAGTCLGPGNTSFGNNLMPGPPPG